MPFQWPGEKLVEKMWETLAEKGVGSLLRPWQSIREGKAQAEVRRHELLALAQAEIDAAEIKAGRKRLQKDGTLLPVASDNVTNFLLLPGSDGRTEPTFDMPQLMRDVAAANAADCVRAEVNVARAVIMAEEFLGQESQDPPTATIEDDWLSTWREYVGRVSSEELQRLWASVLAGEVKAPGTFSLRTLEFLRTLSKAEAEKIARIAPFVVDNYFVPRDLEEMLGSNGITFGVLLEMQDLGILTGVDALGLSVTFKSNTATNFLKPLICHDKILLVQREEHSEIRLAACTLTNLGKEIMALGSFSANIDFLKALGKKLASMQFTVMLGDIISLDANGRINYRNAVQITA